MMSVDLAGVNNPHLLREHGTLLCVHLLLAYSTNTRANLPIWTHNPQEKYECPLSDLLRKKMLALYLASPLGRCRIKLLLK